MILPHDANLRRMEFSETTWMAGWLTLLDRDWQVFFLHFACAPSEFQLT
jgi:hypothetical protein